jgi:hypothetical protein
MKDRKGTAAEGFARRAEEGKAITELTEFTKLTEFLRRDDGR